MSFLFYLKSRIDKFTKQTECFIRSMVEWKGTTLKHGVFLGENLNNLEKQLYTHKN